MKMGKFTKVKGFYQEMESQALGRNYTNTVQIEKSATPANLKFKKLSSIVLDS